MRLAVVLVIVNWLSHGWMHVRDTREYMAKIASQIPMRVEVRR